MVEATTSVVTAPPPPPAQTTQQDSGPPPPAGKARVPGFGLVISTEVLAKPALKQNNSFPITTINQELPDDIKRHHAFYLELLQGEIDFSQGQNNKFNSILKDALEFEQ